MTAPGRETAKRIHDEASRQGYAPGYMTALQATRIAARDAVTALLAGDVPKALDLAHAHELLDELTEAAWRERRDGTVDGVTAADATRACAHCGDEFEPTSPTQTYCTKAHRTAAYRARQREDTSQ